MKLKINKQFWLETFIATLYFWAVEIIFRVVESYNVFSWATFRILLSSFAICLFLNFITSFFHNIKISRIANLILLSIISVYSLTQAGLLNFIGLYMSLGTSSQFGAVTSYILDFIKSLKLEYYLILLPLAIYIIYIILMHKKQESKPFFDIRNRLIIIISFLIAILLYYLTLILPFMQNPLQLVSNIDAFHNPTNSSIAVNQFGVNMYGLLDIKDLIFPYQDEGNVNINNEEINEDENSRKFDDTAWKMLQESTTNNTYKNLNNYFMNRSITSKNDYTGYFEDKNLIILMLESVNQVIDNAEYFPNFAKLMEHGWYWENNYSPRNSCSTINNEESGMTSLYTINNICTGNIYKDNTYFESIFNLFNNKDYKTLSFHDYNEDFYARKTIHKNLYSSHFYDITDVKDYGFEELHWPNDAEYVKKITPYFVNEDKFFVWFTTVSAHHPYSESDLGNLYYDLFSDENYDDSVKEYLSKVKVTDDALGVLLDELEENDILDDTVIILYGDHYPYALSDEEVDSFLPYDVSKGFEIEKTPFLIYNSSIEPQIFETNTSYINLTPTVANLFNLDYDPRLYLGEDLFSDNLSNRVIYADGSWQDDVAIYNSASSTIDYLGEKIYTTEELQRINQDVMNKIRMSNLAISENYFNYLEEGLKEYKKGLDDE